MEKFLEKSDRANEYSPLTLAFIGDGVYDLLVREYLVSQANRPVGELNRLKVSMVCCKAQAETAKALMPILTEEELSVYKRGRNATTSCTPKNSTKAEYHSATGLEALFGYIYLKGDIERIKELFELVIENVENSDSETDEV